MFQLATDEQLKNIIDAAELDPETSLFDSIVYRYAKQKKLKVFIVEKQCVGFIIEEVIDPEAELIQLFVFKAFRGQGFGKTCMKAWINSLLERNVQRAFLEVRQGNKAAIKLYRCLDFMEVGRRKHYYQWPMGTFDAILMDKYL